jgi:NADH-quinone oxidoreductase subunit N
MLAYSAIGNVGFILFGFVAGTEQGYEAALYYTIAYVLTTLGAFGVMLLVSRRGFEADELDHYKGLHARDPLLAFIMMVLMFSLAGIPLTVGFLAKLQIFEALWSSNHLALVVFAAVVSVIGLFYYLRVVKILYFDPPGDLPIPERHGAVKATLALNAGAVVVLGVVPQALIELCARALG